MSIRLYQKLPIPLEVMHVESYAMMLPGDGELWKWMKEYGVELQVDLEPSGSYAGTFRALEGLHTVLVGDYVIKGTRNEFWRIDPDIFRETYVEVS